MGLSRHAGCIEVVEFLVLEVTRTQELHFVWSNLRLSPGSCGTAPALSQITGAIFFFKKNPSFCRRCADKLCRLHPHSGQKNPFLPLTCVAEGVHVMETSFLLFVALLVETAQLVSAPTPRRLRRARVKLFLVAPPTPSPIPSHIRKG